MVTIMDESKRVTIPSAVTDLGSFRRWAAADDFPETGRICYLGGEVWVDMSKEQVFSHVLVKTRFAVALGGLVEAEDLGLFLTDGALLVNVAADLASKPDALFASTAALEDRVRLIEGKEEGHVELEGSPDMVLEVVSASSVHKDTVVLREAYWQAGVREYWLVDARSDTLTFDILCHAARGYRTTRKKDGWLRSGVFGKPFRLTRENDARGHPAYKLAMR